MARKHKRTDIVREIVLQSSAGQRSSRISDMSMGGCYIESITDFRKGETIEFDLASTGGEVLRFSGNVAYVLAGFGFGLTFTNLTPNHVTFLSRTLPSTPRPINEEDSNLLELW
jgi:hypothetical protein